MGLFQKESETDVELNSRVDRLQSECRRARLHCASLPDGADKQNRLKELEAVEEDLAEARGEGEKAKRTRAALRVEAELCLAKPPPMLVTTANRLRDKLYRLYDRHRRDWEKELDRLINNGDVQDEATLRLQLQTLTYELTEVAARYRRLARERSKAIFWVLCASLVIVMMLLGGLVFSFNGLMLGASDGVNNRQDGAGAVLSWARFMPVLFAGGLGAMVNIVPSLIGEKSNRPDYSLTYFLYMIVRVFLGGVYAFIVYSATLAHVLPITIPAETMTAVPFLAVLGFAAGSSDRLFGQVLSGFITGVENSSKKTKSSADSGA